MDSATAVATREPGALAHADAMGDVRGLVMEAIKRGDVDVAERVIALLERGAERDARAAYFSALAAFQEACPPINKSANAKIATKSGAQFGYSYAPLEEIARTIRKPLADNGLSYRWTADLSGNGKALLVTCIVRHVAGHEESSTFPVPIDEGARMSAAQANGAALTYGKRQSLTSVLGLTTADEDTDAVEREQPSAEKVSPEQMRTLEKLLQETDTDTENFLRFYKVDAIAALPQSRFQHAVDTLETKKRKSAQAGAV
jgi:hypothetical protein